VSRPADDFAPALAPEAAAELPPWLAAFGRPAEWPRALAAVRPWEVVAWVAVVAAAAALRLAALGNLPLSPDEALLAMDAWRLWMGRAPSDLQGAAFLTHALLVTFGLLGANEFAARLPTVLAGLALTLAPLLLRPHLGALGALGAGALLALSPIVVFGSRHVDSAILVAALLAWLVGVAARAALAPLPATADPRPANLTAALAGDWAPQSGWRLAVPVLAALLLGAGSVAVPAALAALVAAAITWWPSRGPSAESGVPSASGERGEAPAEGTATTVYRPGGIVPAWGALAARLLPTPPWLVLALFAATLVLVGTAGLTHLRGLNSALVEPWTSWLAPYHARPVAVPWLPTLLLYDLPLVVAAVLGLVVVVRRTRPFEHFLLWWMTLAAVPLVFQPPDPLPFLLAWAVPLALLGGVAIGTLADLGWTGHDAGKDALLAALLAINIVFLVNTLRLLVSTVGSPTGLVPRGRDLAFSALTLLILAVVHWRLAGWWREALRDVPGGARLSRVGAVGLLALGVAFMLLVNDRLQFGREDAGSAELLRPEALYADVYDLAAELQTWYRQEPNVPIFVSASLRPALLWHLRDVATVQFIERPPDPGAAALGRRGVWPVGTDAPQGERRPLRETVTIGPIPSTSVLWSWWVYRNAWLVPTRHDIIVVR
jgi:hypothetical protein